MTLPELSSCLIPSAAAAAVSPIAQASTTRTTGAAMMPCDLERAAWELGRAGRTIGRHPVAVEQAHRALDDHAVGPDRAVHERAPHPFSSEHPGIKVATRPAAGVRQV